MMSSLKAIEALLFVADAPVRIEEIGTALGLTTEEVETSLQELGARLDQSSGLQLVRIAGGYQLCTRAEFAELVARFVKPHKQRLSKSLLEVLAIVAYRQPVTLAEIEAIRGVQSDYSVHALQERRLVREVGRKKAPGRPLLFGTTQQFLHEFNLNDLSELPTLSKELEAIGEAVQPRLL